MNTKYAPLTGRDALWNWFGLSYASWLTMPRVMMHAMPDDWQARMAQLCSEWDAYWSYSEGSPLSQVGSPTVNQRKGGKLQKWPEFLLNYRHPDREQIERCRVSAKNLDNACRLKSGAHTAESPSRTHSRAP